MAAHTTGIRVLTNITVVLYRHPVTLAKLALTFDTLTTGRSDFGVGVGWYRPEFETVGVPFEQGGARTDEFLALFERVCTEPIVDFEGPFRSFEGIGFYLRPVQEGETADSRRRIRECEFSTGGTVRGWLDISRGIRGNRRGSRSIEGRLA